MSKKERADNPFSDMSFGEALAHLTQTKPGELADAIARNMANEVTEIRKRIRATEEEIGRGARTRGKKDRFRL